MNAADIVQRQVEAYNARDLGRFVATYADDIRIFRMPAAEPAISGKMQLAEVYRARFSVPALHADILARIVLGNKVIDHERVGHPAAPDRSAGGLRGILRSHTDGLVLSGGVIGCPLVTA
jgi:hypothetical protein